MSRVRHDGTLALFITVVLLVPAAACLSQGEGDATPTVSAAAGATMGPTAGAAVAARVTLAANIAQAIQADPGSTDRILNDNGMTREAFEDLLYEIAADPVLSESYVRELGS